MKNRLITDFEEPSFKQAFQAYFEELGIFDVPDWNKFFQGMNADEGTKAYVRLTEDDEVVGFVQFKLIELSNWFFQEKLGFVREFWVSDSYRNDGHGSILLELAEEYFVANNVYKSILTTATAEKFYVARGYKKDLNYQAKNEDSVYIKELR